MVPYIKGEMQDNGNWEQDSEANTLAQKEWE